MVALTDMAELLVPTGSAARDLPRPLIDLREVDSARRTVMWLGAATSTFPGLSLKMTAGVPQLGTISRFKLGAGELCAIESAPVELSFRPPGRDGPSPHLSLMVQSHGSTWVCQGERQSRLSVGDICLIDESSSFRMVGEDCSGILFLRLPRGAALSRHPQLERLFGCAMSSADAGTQMLADTLLRLSDRVAELTEQQRAAMMESILQMLGVAGPMAARPQSSEWRIRRATDFIELNLSVAGLSAAEVAQDQHISRRRLDQLMCDAHGQSITEFLWNRRLARAAMDLRDPKMAALTAAQIAFANGFEDAAHFTRAFRRRFGTTPGQWRTISQARLLAQSTRISS
jgi:AraC-like DNA-binding protein